MYYSEGHLLGYILVNDNIIMFDKWNATRTVSTTALKLIEIMLAIIPDWFSSLSLFPGLSYVANWVGDWDVMNNVLPLCVVSYDNIMSRIGKIKQGQGFWLKLYETQDETQDRNQD